MHHCDSLLTARQIVIYINIRNEERILSEQKTSNHLDVTTSLTVQSKMWKKKNDLLSMTSMAVRQPRVVSLDH